MTGRRRLLNEMFSREEETESKEKENNKKKL